MRIRLYKRRSTVIPYTPVINLVVNDELDTVRIEKLTGDLTLNLIDPFGKDGDYVKILLEADGVAPRTVTFAGPQGAPGVAVLAVGVAALYLVYHGGIGQYASVVAP